jgi:4'-phosphopantetheinyl transferase
MQIYIVKISDIIGEFGEEKLYQMLPEFRKAAVRQCRQEADRRRSLAAGLLLCFCMHNKGVSLEETPSFHENGKLYFPRHPEFCVNLSHGGDYAACAVDTREIGVDIEAIRPYRENVARRICPPEEMQELLCLHKEEQNPAFTRLWTAKESAVKLLGEGIASLLKVSQTGEPRIYTKTYMPVEGYFLSVSSHEDEFPDEVTVLSPECLLQ